MNLNYSIRGTCHSRIHFGAFQGSNDPGIRCHNAIVACFLRCLGKITDLTLANGTTIYLNKASYEKWKTAQENAPKLPNEFSPILETSLKVVTYYVDRQIGKNKVAEVAQILNTNVDNDIALMRGVPLLEEAAKKNVAFMFYKLPYQWLLTTLKQSSDYVTLSQSINLLSKRVESEEKRIKEGQCRLPRVITLTETARKLLDVFTKALRTPIPYEEISKTLDGLDQKEWGAYRIGCDEVSWGIATAIEFANKHNFDNSKAVNKIREQYKVRSLVSAIVSISGKFGVGILDAQKAELHVEQNKLIGAIKDAIRDDKGVDEAMHAAADLADKYAFREQLKPYRDLLDWMLNLISYTGKLSSDELQKRASAELTKWNKVLGEFSATGPKEDVEAFQAIIDGFQAYVNGQNPLLNIPEKGRKLFGSLLNSVNPASMDFSKIDAIKSKDDSFVQAVQKRAILYTLLQKSERISIDIRSYLEKSKAMMTAETLKNEANVLLENCQYDEACNKLLEASEAATSRVTPLRIGLGREFVEGNDVRYSSYERALRNFKDGWVKNNGFSRENAAKLKTEVEEQLKTMEPQVKASNAPIMGRILDTLQKFKDSSDTDISFNGADVQLLKIKKPQDDINALAWVCEFPIGFPLGHGLLKECATFVRYKIIKSILNDLNKPI